MLFIKIENTGQMFMKARELKSQEIVGVYDNFTFFVFDNNFVISADIVKLMEITKLSYSYIEAKKNEILGIDELAKVKEAQAEAQGLEYVNIEPPADKVERAEKIIEAVKEVAKKAK